MSSTQAINIANASAGKLAGVRWDGHHHFKQMEFQKGAAHKGKASDAVIINWVVIVKLNGRSPLMFQDKIVKHTNINGVVKFLKGLRAAVSPFRINNKILEIILFRIKCVVR